MIVIIGALDEEISAFSSLLTAQESFSCPSGPGQKGRLFGHSVAITRSGVGKVFAAMTTQFLIDKFSPRAIIFTGLAGALNEHYEIGDLVLGTECIQHDLETSALGFRRGEVPYCQVRELAADPVLFSLASSYSPVGHKLHHGRILTGDQFISLQDRQHYLITELNGDCVEMEGAATAFVANRNGVPALVTRTISDRADHNATVDFAKFLPVAAANAVGLVSHILQQKI